MAGDDSILKMPRGNKRISQFRIFYFESHSFKTEENEDVLVGEGKTQLTAKFCKWTTFSETTGMQEIK